MSRYDDIKARVDKLESYVYKELPQLIQENNNKDMPENVGNNLLKYKPSKHRKAYKIERNLKKRCYTR
ncbi:MAG: hypothetical protein K0R50_3653 [Eubacterium sp.]|jgi:hypothetical protein|nr:hypothetical protein [Eubacterium sp.]